MNVKRILSLVLVCTLMMSAFAMPTAAFDKEMAEIDGEVFEEEIAADVFEALDQNSTESSSLDNNCSISTDTVTVGGKVLLKAEGIDGIQPYTYAFFYKSQEATSWKTIKGYSGEDSVEMTFNETSVYDVCIKVKDSSGTVSKRYFTVTVNAGVLQNNSCMSAENIFLNESVTLTGVGIGGSPLYQYTYCYKAKSETVWRVIRTYSSIDTATLKPGEAGIYDVCVKVKDSDGTVAKKFFTLDVLKNEFDNNTAISNTEPAVNEPVRLTGAANGGVQPYSYAYYYKASGAGEWTTIQNTSDFNLASFRAAASEGEYDVKCVIKDSNGLESGKVIHISVKNKPLNNLSNVDAGTVMPGENVILQAVGFGGNAPYQYAFFYKKHEDSSWTTAKGYTETDRLDLTIEEEGTYDLCIKVRDSDSSVSKRYFTVTASYEADVYNTVYFCKPNNWNTPYVYYSDSESNGANWYKLEMQNNVDNGLEIENPNWYECDLTKYENTRIIFTDGTNIISTYNNAPLVVSESMWYKENYWDNGQSDSDEDGLLDFIELIIGTDPQNTDTDNDQFSDYYEAVVLGTDPLIYNDDSDFDNDNLTNRQEMNSGTNPYLVDSDFDGINDNIDSEPLKTDTNSGLTANYNIDVPVGIYDNREEYQDSNGVDCVRIYNKLTGKTKLEKMATAIPPALDDGLRLPKA